MTDQPETPNAETARHVLSGTTSGEHMALPVIQAMVDTAVIKATQDNQRNKTLRYTQNILFTIVMLISVTVAYIQSKQNEDLLRQTSNKLVCSGRFQDVVDLGAENQLITIGELIVVITQTAPGEDRQQAVLAKITQLDKYNIEVNHAVNQKIRWNNDGRPLPCPLIETKPSVIISP